MNKAFANFIFFLLCLSTLFFGAPAFSAGEDKLSLTVTPPLFQLTVSPGEVWDSNLKIVNTNAFDLTVYASVMNFSAQGEEGRGHIYPLLNDQNSDKSLARWIEISKEPIIIPPQKSADLPFSVRIPTDAEPGGHYAAILVGTQPSGEKASGAIVRVSSNVTSLLFLRVSGDVKEEGGIREFRSEKSFYQEPSANFILRFENTGNVHLHPQGYIDIYNMWGEERGKIVINQENDFGNVLPGTIRQFVFPWKSKQRLWEAGRYTAVATLSFGKDMHQNVSVTASLWIVPVKRALAAAGGIFLFCALVIFAIRTYIRRSLARTKLELGIGFGQQDKTIKEKPKTRARKPAKRKKKWGVFGISTYAALAVSAAVGVFGVVYLLKSDVTEMPLDGEKIMMPSASVSSTVEIKSEVQQSTFANVSSTASFAE